MITIIPALEIMKSVTDDNIDSPASQTRSKAFDKCHDLMSLSDVDILLDGNVFERVCPRLTEEHKTFFRSVYRIDNSAVGVEEYDHVRSIKWVAISEAKSRFVIILTENGQDYVSATDERIVTCGSQIFLERVEKAEKLYRSKMFSSIEDALVALFFSKIL